MPHLPQPPTLVALALALAGAGIVATTGQGTLLGALCGLVVAVIAILGLGAGALFPLALFVLGSGALTRVGQTRKEAAGTAEPRKGKRGALHVAAKLGVPLAVGAAALWIRQTTAAGEPRDAIMVLSTAYAAALAAAFSDTAATEIGPLVSGPVVAVRGIRLVPVEHGTPGGVSATGLLAGALAAALGAASAAASRLIPGRAWLAVAAAGFGATVLESAFAGSGAGRALGHHGRNGLVSLLAAAAASAWAIAGGTP